MSSTDQATNGMYTLSLHDALPIYPDGDAISTYEFWDSGIGGGEFRLNGVAQQAKTAIDVRSEEHTTELQSHVDLACSQLLAIRDYDGELWGDWASTQAQTLRATNT